MAQVGDGIQIGQRACWLMTLARVERSIARMYAQVTAPRSEVGEGDGGRWSKIENCGSSFKRGVVPKKSKNRCSVRDIQVDSSFD